MMEWYINRERSRKREREPWFEKETKKVTVQPTRKKWEVGDHEYPESRERCNMGTSKRPRKGLSQQGTK